MSSLGSEYSDTNSELFDTKEISVSSIAVEAVTDPVALDRDLRQSVRIYNQGPNTVYCGPTGVTASGGIKPGEPLRKHQWIKYDVKGDATKIFVITATGESASVIVTDLG